MEVAGTTVGTASRELGVCQGLQFDYHSLKTYNTDIRSAHNAFTELSKNLSVPKTSRGPCSPGKKYEPRSSRPTTTFKHTAQLFNTFAHSQSSENLCSLFVCTMPHYVENHLQLSGLVGLVGELRANVLLSSHAFFNVIVTDNRAGCTPLTARSQTTTL